MAKEEEKTEEKTEEKKENKPNEKIKPLVSRIIAESEISKNKNPLFDESSKNKNK